MSSNIIVGGPAPMANYYGDIGQSISDSTLTTVDFEIRVTDLQSSVTTGASWAFVAPAAGIYSIEASVVFSANIVGFREVYIRVNGTAQAYNVMNGSSITTVLSLDKSLSLVRGDSIDIQVNQNSGGSLALVSGGGPSYNYITITKIG